MRWTAWTVQPLAKVCLASRVPSVTAEWMKLLPGREADVAIEVADWDIGRPAGGGQKGDTAIGEAIVAETLGLEGDSGGGVRLPDESGSEGVAVFPVEVPLAALMLGGSGKDESRAACGVWGTTVSRSRRAALLAVAAGGVAELAEGTFHAGLLTDAIDEAARGAAAVEDGSRTLDHLDALGIREVAVVLGVVADPVDVHVDHGVEAADKEVVAATLAKLEADGWEYLDRLLHGVRGPRTEELPGEDLDLLRSLKQGDRHARSRGSESGFEAVGADFGDLGGARDLQCNAERLGRERHGELDRLEAGMGDPEMVLAGSNAEEGGPGAVGGEGDGGRHALERLQVDAALLENRSLRVCNDDGAAALPGAAGKLRCGVPKGATRRRARGRKT